MKLVLHFINSEHGFFVNFPSGNGKLKELLNECEKKYNSYVSLEIKKPYKARTTGKGSQNNLFWKLVEIIANETGEDVEEIERAVKLKAISKGYPYHVSKLTGQPVPESMTKINTVEMSYLIDTEYEIIAFLGIILEPEYQKAKE